MTTWFTLRANSALVADEWMKQINAAQVCRRERREGEGREEGGSKKGRKEGGREIGGGRKGGRKGKTERWVGRGRKDGWWEEGYIDVRK